MTHHGDRRVRVLRLHADRNNRSVRDVRTPIATDGRLDTAAKHPGLSDPQYLLRRRAIASSARGHRVGDPSPRVEYTEAEQRTWRTVHQRLWDAQHEHACRAALNAREQAPVPAEHIPQHAEVGLRLRRLTGFDFTLAGGVVGNKRFLGSMAHGYFHAVQFVRHPAVPMFTPEPDIIHDVSGHGIHLASPTSVAGISPRLQRAAWSCRASAAADVDVTHP